MVNRLIVLLGVLALVGCANTTKSVDVAAIAASPKTEVNFDKRLLVECPPLIRAKSSREEDVKVWADDTIKKYSACATLKAKTDQEIRKALNIKD
jgi:hypothetical protein